jgi:predicted N-formylglutamate amidohydrolase
MSIIISCEHAGREIPDKYVHYFASHLDVIETHRGWDPGAWEVASDLGEKLKVSYFGCRTTRLLIEVNRSLNHSQLFSEFSNKLTTEEKTELIDGIYFPYRTSVQTAISNAKQSVLHLSIHSFTPVLNGVEREFEIGLLFDPDRSRELSFCEDFTTRLAKALPGFRIKLNEPYKGVDDGFTTYLRTQFDNEFYSGIEIEINQHLVGSKDWELVKDAFVTCAMVYKFSS